MDIDSGRIINTTAAAKELPENVSDFLQEVHDAGYRISYTGLALIASHLGLSNFSRVNEEGKANRVPTVWAKKLREDVQGFVCRAGGGYHPKSGYEDDGTPVLDPDYAVELFQQYDAE